MEKNKQIEKTLNSLDGIKKADVNPFLYEKIMSLLENTHPETRQEEAKVISIAPRIIWQAAACFAVLITLNVFVWTRSKGIENTQTESNNPLAQEYFSFINNTQF